MSEELRVDRKIPTFGSSCDLPDQRKLVENTIDSAGASPRLLHQPRDDVHHGFSILHLSDFKTEIVHTH
jgi:hypothetical protein